MNEKREAQGSPLQHSEKAVKSDAGNGLYHGRRVP